MYEPLGLDDFQFRVAVEADASGGIVLIYLANEFTLHSKCSFSSHDGAVWGEIASTGLFVEFFSRSGTAGSIPKRRPRGSL